MGSLFKYRACGVNTDKVFTTGCLHYSNRTTFNDPYDCLLLIDKSKIFYRHGVGLFSNRETREVLLELSTDDIESKYQSVADRIEIFCLSTDGKQMQMWSHYANNHTGICLEFDDDLLCNSLGDMFRVQYPKEQYVLKLKTPEVTENNIIEAFCTKQKGWEYEQEIRMFRSPNPSKPDKNYPFNKQALKAIYFGSFCTQRNISKYKRLCRLNGFEHVKFYKMKLTNNGIFELNCEEI
jgi:hypothetical protein